MTMTKRQRQFCDGDDFDSDASLPMEDDSSCDSDPAMITVPTAEEQHAIEEFVECLFMTREQEASLRTTLHQLRTFRRRVATPLHAYLKQCRITSVPVNLMDGPQRCLQVMRTATHHHVSKSTLQKALRELTVDALTAITARQSTCLSSAPPTVLDVLTEAIVSQVNNVCSSSTREVIVLSALETDEPTSSTELRAWVDNDEAVPPFPPEIMEKICALRDVDKRVLELRQELQRVRQEFEATVGNLDAEDPSASGADTGNTVTAVCEAQAVASASNFSRIISQYLHRVNPETKYALIHVTADNRTVPYYLQEVSRIRLPKFQRQDDLAQVVRLAVTQVLASDEFECSRACDSDTLQQTAIRLFTPGRIQRLTDAISTAIQQHQRQVHTPRVDRYITCHPAFTVRKEPHPRYELQPMSQPRKRAREEADG